VYHLGCIADEVLGPIATKFKLYMMRDCFMTNQEALELFYQEQQWIPRDFEFGCGCTLVHFACDSCELALLKALDQHGFELTSINKKGETPLHRSVSDLSTECTHFLLKRLLGQFYVPLVVKREVIVARTPDEQRLVEDAVCLRDAKGRTPLFTAFSNEFVDWNSAQMLIYNLLGPLVVLESEELVTRTYSEQLQAERILIDRDTAGFSTLHGAARYGYRASFLLKDLLGKAYIDGKNRPMKTTLKKQQQIAQLLQPKNQEGVTPLLICALHCRNCYTHLLFLMNLLGEYFLENDATTARPLDARTYEENQFVRAVMFGEDDEGRSAFYTIATSQDCDEYVKLLYKVNGSYLQQKPQIPRNFRNSQNLDFVETI
jgi:ankyrin repeat protein